MTAELGRIRKTYVTARVEENTLIPRGYAGNWRQYRKDQAHREFNELIAAERAAAVSEYLRTICD